MRTDLQIDGLREARQGFPEVVMGEGKSSEQIVAAMTQLYEINGHAFATRVASNKAETIMQRLVVCSWDPVSETLSWGAMSASGRHLAVLAAGTSDVRVAEEAARTAEFMGHEVLRFYDVGVAGLQRLLDRMPQIQKADVVMVVAGMEGALPSVVGGLLGQPVIAVPTSVGYGTGLGGVAALLAMLNTCAAGVTVVNIDNGFGAAVAAHRVLNLLQSTE